MHYLHSQKCSDLLVQNCSQGNSFNLNYVRNSQTCWNYLNALPFNYNLAVVSEKKWFAYDPLTSTLYHSENMGKTWVLLSYLPWISDYSGKIKFSNENVGYFLTLKGHLWKTSNGGISWSIIFQNNGNLSGQNVTLDCLQNNVIISIGTTVYYSSDGGLNYNSQLDNNFETKPIKKAILKNNQEALIHNGRYAYYTNNTGKNWYQVSGNIIDIRDIDVHQNIIYIVRGTEVLSSSNGSNWFSVKNKNSLNPLSGPLLVNKNYFSGNIEMWINEDFSIDEGCLTNNYDIGVDEYYKNHIDNSLFLRRGNDIYSYACTGELTPHDVPHNAREIDISGDEVFVNNFSSSYGINNSNNPTCWINKNFERPYWLYWKGTGKVANINIEGNDRLKVAVYEGFLNCNLQIYCSESVVNSNVINTTLNTKSDKYYFLVVDQNNLSGFKVKYTQSSNLEDNKHTFDKGIYFDYEMNMIRVMKDGIDEIGIISLYGMEQNLDVYDGSGQINIDFLHPGVYIVKYKIGNIKYHFKILKGQ